MSQTNDQKDSQTADPKPPKMLKDGGHGGEVPAHDAGKVPQDTTGRVDLKNDGNPNVTGDVRGE